MFCVTYGVVFTRATMGEGRGDPAVCVSSLTQNLSQCLDLVRNLQIEDASLQLQTELARKDKEKQQLIGLMRQYVAPENRDIFERELARQSSTGQTDLSGSQPHSPGKGMSKLRTAASSVFGLRTPGKTMSPRSRTHTPQGTPVPQDSIATHRTVDEREVVRGVMETVEESWAFDTDQTTEFSTGPRIEIQSDPSLEEAAIIKAAEDLRESLAAINSAREAEMKASVTQPSPLRKERFENHFRICAEQCSAYLEEYRAEMEKEFHSDMDKERRRLPSSLTNEQSATVEAKLKQQLAASHHAELAALRTQHEQEIARLQEIVTDREARCAMAEAEKLTRKEEMAVYEARLAARREQHNRDTRARKEMETTLQRVTQELNELKQTMAGVHGEEEGEDPELVRRALLVIKKELSNQQSENEALAAELDATKTKLKKERSASKRMKESYQVEMKELVRRHLLHAGQTASLSRAGEPVEAAEPESLAEAREKISKLEARLEIAEGKLGESADADFPN